VISGGMLESFNRAKKWEGRKGKTLSTGRKEGSKGKKGTHFQKKKSICGEEV